jgi:hypothetical protein
MLGMMMADPDAALQALDPERVERCSSICGKTAEKLIETLSQEA